MKKLKLLFSVCVLIAVSNFTTAQTLSWAKLSNQLTSKSISLDGSGNAYTLHQNYYLEKRNTSGTLIWTKQLTGPLGGVNDAAADHLGNLYVTGFYYSDINQSNYGGGLFYIGLTGGGLISVPFTVVPDGYILGYKMFLAKINVSGSLEYVKTFSTNTDYSEGHSLTTDLDNNVYLMAEGSNSMNFGGGVGTLNDIHPLFLLKMDVSGTSIYLKQIVNSFVFMLYGTNTPVNQIAVNDNEEVVITQKFTGTRVFDPNGAAVSLTSAGYNDVFIVRYNAGGAFQWAKKFGSTTQHETSHGIVLDNSGNLYCCGLFGGTCDFDPGAGVVNKTPNGVRDMYVLSLNNTGGYRWVSVFGGTADESPLSLIQSEFDLMVTGAFTGTVDFNPGASVNNLVSAGGKDIFTLGLGKGTGNYNTAYRVGSTGDDVAMDIATPSQTAQAPYTIYQTGTFNGTVDFNPEAGITNLTSTGSAKAFVTKSSINIGSGRYSTANDMNENLLPVKVYPDPFVSSFRIDSDIELYSISIYSVNGSLVYSENARGKNTIELDLSMLKKGLYTLLVNTEKGIESTRISKL